MTMNKSRIKLAIRLALKNENHFILIATGLKKRLPLLLQLFVEYLKEEAIEFEYNQIKRQITFPNNSRIDFRCFLPETKVQGMQDLTFFDAAGKLDNKTIKQVLQRSKTQIKWQS